MNRIILIGNGFDLAHQMQTSYYGFIYDYIKEAFRTALNGRFDDELMSVRRIYGQVPSIDSFRELNDFFRYLVPSRRSIIYFLREDSSDRGRDLPLKWEIKNDFVEHLFTVCHQCRWVDIENEYYARLVNILEDKNEKSKKSSIETLNSSFDVLKKLLVSYLGKVMPGRPNNKYNKYFFEKIKRNEVVTKILDKDETPAETLVLNFNYTPTVEPYFKGNSQTKINYIHGALDREDNPIIFGFGDELDNDYARLENEKIKGFLHHVKSFWYFKTSNYHDLIRFIESDEFQVQVFGHSCGLSDRTMLNMIFEHRNCLSIKIFYYQSAKGNNYSDLTEEISRHFHDKGLMRRKIVPFDKSFPMPQLPQA